MKARILVPVIGASLALIGPATHAAGARNALHCTLATPKAATTQKPFFSPHNPRGLLVATSKLCVAKKTVKATGHKQPKLPQLQPTPAPPAPIVVPSADVTLPTTPTLNDPNCLTYLDYPEYEIALCSPAAPTPAATPAQDTQAAQDAQATQDASGEPPLAAVEQPAQEYYSNS